MGFYRDLFNDVNNDILDIFIKAYHENKISINELIKKYIEIKWNKNEIIYGNRKNRK